MKNLTPSEDFHSNNKKYLTHRIFKILICFTSSFSVTSIDTSFLFYCKPIDKSIPFSAAIA